MSKWHGDGDFDSEEWDGGCKWFVPPNMQQGEMPAVERHGDMGRGVKLRLRTDSDGDVHVVCDGVDQMTGKPASVSVEFCRPGLGGGRSPRTLEALRALMFAMQAENDSSPFEP